MRKRSREEEAQLDSDGLAAALDADEAADALADDESVVIPARNGQAAPVAKPAAAKTQIPSKKLGEIVDVVYAKVREIGRERVRDLDWDTNIVELGLDSLERMVDLHDIRTVLPAHGLPFDNLAERCRDIQAHHHERLELLRTAGADLGLATVEEYSQRLFKPVAWGPMADSETYAHLEHLALAGQAVRSEVRGQPLRYRLVG